MKYKLLHRMRQMWENIWNHVLMLGLLALGACSSEDVTPPVIDPVIPTETAYISLDIGFKSNLITKGYEGESKPGESEEDYVTKVRLVLYDGNLSTSKVVQVFDYQIETDDSGGTESWKDNSSDQKDLATTVNQKDKSHFITYARKVPSMDYYMLAIVNPTAYLESITKEDALFSTVETAYKVESGVNKTQNVGGLAAEKNFLMTSGPELIQIKTTDLSATVREAHNKPVSATVARVVSKVTLTPPEGQSSIPTNYGAEIGSVQWELDVTNRYTFWMKKFDSADRKNEYGQDPNFSGFGGNASGRVDNFFYYSSLGEEMPTFDYQLNESEYCLENTMDLNDQKEKNVITRALIRCAYKPANVENVGDGFYVFNGTAYSFREMKDFADKAEKTPAGPSRPAFCDAILAAKGSGYTFLTGEPVKGSQVVTEPFEVEGITYYHNGINYYAIKILHLGTDEKTEVPSIEGYYGVVRNTQYTIHIEKINGPGSPGILWDDIITRSGEQTGDSRLYSNIETSIKVD